MTLYHIPHPETGETIVIDRMTDRDAYKRNESFEAMRYPYRWVRFTEQTTEHRRAA
jgi:hypothetical protein